jgi:hypothetical protein
MTCDESLSSQSLLKLLAEAGAEVSQRKSQNLHCVCLSLLPENEPYLIPINISEERIGDSLCHGTSIGMKHLLMALMVAGLLVGSESRCGTKNTKHRHILYSSYPKNTACIQAYYVQTIQV